MLFTNFKKAHSSLHYALLIGLMVAVALTMQNYLKRGVQGKIQATSDQISEPYDYGFTAGHERFNSSTHSFEFTTAGWNHPTTVTHTEGDYNSHNRHSFRPLKARPPK